jgi:membrane-bound metal-dependent hydrolase YbcI (DUF457 family)
VFIGHFAVGFAAKRAAPRTSLAVLFTAAQLADLLWPVLVAVGIEQVRIDPGNTAFTPLDFVSYPYSHSLLLLVVWGLLIAAVYRAVSGHNGRAAATLFLLVVSHWVLDWVTHRPDMPLYPGGPKLGLGLWNSPGATVAVEVLMFAAGVVVYARATRPRDRAGRWSFAALVIALLAVYAANVLSGPPPSVSAVWQAGIPGAALLLVWSWWADRHRRVVPSV